MVLISKDNKLLFFTDPYPDELLYSVLARFHYYNAGLPYGKSQAELLASKRNVPSIYLGYNLNFLADRLSHCYDAHSLIDEHTVFPYYSMFLKEESRVKVLESLLTGKDSSVVISRLGITRKNFPKSFDKLRFCPECLKEDYDNYGEGYFHTIHHIPGLDICAKHFCRLLNYPLTYEESRENQYHRLDYNRVSATETIFCENRFEINLAREFLELRNYPNVVLEDFCTRFENFYYNYGYLTNHGFNGANLYQDLIDYFGEDYLIEKNATVSLEAKAPFYNTYLAAFKPQTRICFQPHQLLLLVQYFTEDLSSFLQKPSPKRDIQKHGLSCQNPACPNYNKKGLVDYNIMSRKGHQLIVCRCSCGMIYTTTVERPDTCKIIQYGNSFFDKAFELIDSGLRFKEVAEKLGISPRTLRKIRNGDIKATPIDDKLVLIKERLEQKITEHPEYTLKDLVRPDSSIEYYLNRYDHDYYVEKVLGNFPEKHNFETKDRLKSEEVKDIYENLIQVYPSIRITKKLLREKLGISKNNLNVLVRTKAEIDKYAESVMDYYIREITPILEKIRTLGLIVNKKLLHEVGFKHSFETKNGKLLWSMIKSGKI